MTLNDLCTELKNWFDTSRYFGTFTIRDGVINLSDLEADKSIQEGQYFRIIGSVFNDGVYQHGNIPDGTLKDESFDGAIWPMAIPPEVMGLLDEINDWETKLEESGKKNSPYSSESFGGYSYSIASNSSAAGQNADFGSWQSAFASRLNRWRKARAV
jgi:hypothetical protein